MYLSVGSDQTATVGFWKAESQASSLSPVISGTASDNWGWWGAHLPSWSQRKQDKRDGGTANSWIDTHVGGCLGPQCTASSPFWTHREWVVCLPADWYTHSANFTKGYTRVPCRAAKSRKVQTIFLFENGYFPSEIRIQFSSSKDVGAFHVSLTDPHAEFSSGVDWDPGNTLQLCSWDGGRWAVTRKQWNNNFLKSILFIPLRFISTKLRSCGCAWAQWLSSQITSPETTLWAPYDLWW